MAFTRIEHRFRSFNVRDGLLIAFLFSCLFTIAALLILSAYTSPSTPPVTLQHIAILLTHGMFSLWLCLMGIGAIRRHTEKIVRLLDERFPPEADASPSFRAVSYYIPDDRVVMSRGHNESSFHILHGRYCRFNSDGSVDLDTRLGYRRFQSVEEAETFIGAESLSRQVRE